MSADVLVQLSEHMDVLADQIDTLAAEGRYWWFRPSDNTFHATQAKAAAAPGDEYLLDAFPAWQAQWDGDWAAATQSLITVLTDALNAALNQPPQHE